MNWSALNSNGNPSRFRFELAMENAIWKRENGKKTAAELELFIKLPWKLNQIKMNWMCHILVATTLSTTAAARWGKNCNKLKFFSSDDAVRRRGGGEKCKNHSCSREFVRTSAATHNFFILLLRTRLHPHAPSLSFMHFSDDEFQHQQQSSQHLKRANIFLSCSSGKFQAKPAATTNKWINQQKQQRQWHRGVERSREKSGKWKSLEFKQI